VGPDSVVGIVTRYGLDGPWIESWWRQYIPHTSRPVLGTIKPPVQWVPVLFPNGTRACRWPPPHLAPRLKKEKNYTCTLPLALR